MRTLALNHIALEVSNPEPVAAFYREILGLSEISRHFRPDKTLRSIWLSFGPNGEKTPFLAIEQIAVNEPKNSKTSGFSFVAFHISASERKAWKSRFAEHQIAIEHETQWTLYIRDPEGNRVGVSHYPDFETKP